LWGLSNHFLAENRIDREAPSQMPSEAAQMADQESVGDAGFYGQI
jgi:hypothetical protein